MTHMQRLSEIVPLRCVPKVFPTDQSGPGSILWQHFGRMSKSLNEYIYLYPEWHWEEGTAGERGPTCWPLTFPGTAPACRNEQHSTGAADPFHETLPGWHGGAGHSCEGFAQSPGSPWASLKCSRREQGAGRPQRHHGARSPSQEPSLFISNEHYRHLA